MATACAAGLTNRPCVIQGGRGSCRAVFGRARLLPSRAFGRARLLPSRGQFGEGEAPAEPRHCWEGEAPAEPRIIGRARLLPSRGSLGGGRGSCRAAFGRARLLPSRIWEGEAPAEPHLEAEPHLHADPNLRTLPTCQGGRTGFWSRTYHHGKTFISPWYGHSSDVFTRPARTGLFRTYSHLPS